MSRLLNSMGVKSFCATRIHLPKLIFHALLNINIHAFEGALDGLIFEGGFTNYTLFNAFVTVLSFLVLNLTNKNEETTPITSRS